jgi:endonuclease YncB( thermonuclease family)
MRRLVGLGFVLAGICLAAAPAVSQTQKIRILDGRTLTLDGRGIRLCGIAVPKLEGEAAKAARQALADIIGGRRIMCIAVNDGTPCDGYSPPRTGRLIVAQCWAGKDDIALAMVRRGLARDVPALSDGYYR